MMGLDLCFQGIRERTGSRGVWVPSLRKGNDDQSRMLESLGKLYCLGLNVGSVQLPCQSAAPVRLPTYCFDRQRCWSAAAERGQHVSTAPAVPAGSTPAAASVGDNTASSNKAVAPVPGGTSEDVHRVMLEHMALVDQYLALAEGKKSI